MDFKTLKTFHSVVKHRSFARAAEELNYVQSTVTMQIQRLEAELGVLLLDREKEIRLTEAGRLFYEQSLRMAKDMEQLQARLADLPSGEAGDIRIGVTEPTASYRLPRLLQIFLSRYPAVRVSVEVANTPILCERVRKGELDFALATAPDLGTELHFEPWLQEEFVLLVPSGHPLSHKKRIAPKELSAHRLLITSSTCPYRRKLEMVMKDIGEVALDTMEIGSMTALRHYVESGLGVALIPKQLAEPRGEGTEIREIQGSLISMTLGMLCKRSAYPFPSASEKLYQHLKEHLFSSFGNLL
ncbi:LysR family transcriptional regulator [Gorillibacterium sp. CAU 1737]|uniref:LysR family transcriptional regulator n=1 Tax=Gorillibacterium sp. CAU 1737 TaxID=3140362 RepID=UPI003260460C